MVHLHFPTARSAEVLSYASERIVYDTISFSAWFSRTCHIWLLFVSVALCRCLSRMLQVCLDTLSIFALTRFVGAATHTHHPHEHMSVPKFAVPSVNHCTRRRRRLHLTSSVGAWSGPPRGMAICFPSAHLEIVWTHNMKMNESHVLPALSSAFIAMPSVYRGARGTFPARLSRHCKCLRFIDANFASVKPSVLLSGSIVHLDCHGRIRVLKLGCIESWRIGADEDVSRQCLAQLQVVKEIDHCGLGVLPVCVADVYHSILRRDG